MAFPENLKRMRITKGLTQQELSVKSGIASQKISNYENADKDYMPSVENIKKICMALDCSILDLIEDVKPANRIKETPAQYSNEISRIIYLLKKHPKAVKFIMNELSFIDQSNDLVSLENIISAIMQLTPDKRKALLALLG
jgi:transcriptional regulator with XRE-family HTH domain